MRESRTNNYSVRSECEQIVALQGSDTRKRIPEGTATRANIRMYFFQIRRFVESLRLVTSNSSVSYKLRLIQSRFLT